MLVLSLLFYARVLLGSYRKCLWELNIFDWNFINGVAAMRATKMVLVTVSSTHV